MGEVDTPVLEDVSLQIRQGEWVVILGVSGSGKTTLLNLIGALDRPDSGKVIVDGEEISHLNRWERTDFRRRKVGFIFQFYNLIPTLTAQENVETVLELIGIRGEVLHARARGYLEAVGLHGKEEKFPSQLSGGEQQRVAIARALAKEPSLVLADEPTGNLDERTSNQVIDLMSELKRRTGTTFVIVTHNRKLGEIADRVVELHLGRVVEAKA
jgi:putative ABC transport system ATP-binding protein